MKARLFVCGDMNLEELDLQISECETTHLRSSGPDSNVHIRLEDVSRAFATDLSPRFVDLIEIAAYVYTADCSVPRSGTSSANSAVEPWSRDFTFVVPVRDHAFWVRSDVIDLLRRILLFLSDDHYTFVFSESRDVAPLQSYLDFGLDEDWPFHTPERVLMFSGGLDSLAGALETIEHGDNIVLVSHRAAPTLSKRQVDLFQRLKELYPDKKLLHIPVWINKEKGLGREHTQRTRSFLYAAIGAAVASSVQANGVRFFENGIVSLNLPVADEVLRARASRTTHPLFLAMMSQLLALVFERDFHVDNPYIYKTKTDVLTVIKNLNGNSLIRSTCSCAHTGFFQSKTQWHCGTCSQCIDRRIAIIAADMEADDPDYDYVSDVFVGPRKDGYEKNMAVDFIRHAFELRRMSEQEMNAKFNLQLSRAVKAFTENRRDAASSLIEMHKRHGETVWNVIECKLSANLRQLVAGEFPSSCMLMSVTGMQHMSDSWVRYANRISDLLAAGVPVACNSEKPKHEPHLQEICDGILRAHDNNLVREYPFLRWSSAMTKPDWSVEEIGLWVEAKYVREKRDIRQITEDIAADITKYGDNERNVLFVIYDPRHLIVDDQEFTGPIVQRRGMMVKIIR